MRHVRYFLLGAVAMLVIGGYGFVYRPVPVPGVAFGIDPQCIAAMRRPPDLTWTAPGHSGSGARATPISYAQLPAHGGKFVRVAGVLHAADGGALYRSRDRIEALATADRNADLRVALATLWPGERWELTKSPYIWDRCAAIEGTVEVAGGRFGGVDSLRDVTKLDVWSMPHRPFFPPPPPPQRTAAAEAERKSRERLLNDLHARLGADGPRRTLAAVMTRAEDRQVLMHAMGTGGREALDMAAALRRVADEPALAVLRRGLQEAMGTNTLNVVQLVSEGTFDLREACHTDAIPPSIDRVRATVDAVGQIDWRIANLLDIDDASLSMVANACIGELRREREAVLARAAAGSEPWRPRPGAVR